MNAIAIAALALAASTAQAAAPKLACYEQPGSLATTCIDEANVTANGSVRSSPLYTGGPQDVRKSSSTVVVDCKAGVMVLRDRKGVNHSGGPTSATRLSTALSSWLCEAKNPKKDPTLRQF